LRKLLALSLLVLLNTLAALEATSTAQARMSHYVRNGLLCIHSHEASWYDHGWPYWGGLQMDRNFMKAYGRKFYYRWGTADHWPIWAQLQAGARGYHARGWNPWPNTARLCGLM
jgi:hypothetical protein